MKTWSFSQLGKGEKWSEMIYERNNLRFEVNCVAFPFIHIIISQKREIDSEFCTVKIIIHRSTQFLFLLQFVLPAFSQSGTVARLITDSDYS